MFRLFKFLKTAALFFSLASVVSCMEENIIPLNEVTAEHGKVFEKDGEKWVSLNLNSMNEDLQSARSVIAENPLLYFSVTASTLKSGTGVNLKADCSYSASAAAGTYVAHPYYASQRNKMNGLNLTLKVGRAYWFTVYGTSSAPASLCANDSAVLDADFTGCTAYSDFSTLGSKQAAYLSSLGAGIYTSSSDYNGELVYYGIRQRITELLEQDAVVKGSVQYYIGDDDDGNVLIYKGADSSGLPVQVMTVEVDSDGIEGTGHAFIPVELQETSSLSSVGLEVRRIRFYWTSRTDSSDDGYMQVPVGAGLHFTSDADVSFVLKPYIRTGVYDTDLVFETTTDGSTYTDVFTIHDTLKVFKNQEAVLLGNGSYIKSGIAGSLLYEGNPSSCTGAAVPVTEVYPYDIASYQGTAQKSYRITSSGIQGYLRTVFYVSGTGNKIISCTSGTEKGSLLHPYKSVADAVDAVMEQMGANGKGSSFTEWNIVVDGTPEVSEPSVINYTSAVARGRDFNIVVRNFNGSPSVGMSETFTVNNTSSNDVNITFTNTAWADPSLKVLSNTGSGSINLMEN